MRTKDVVFDILIQDPVDITDNVVEFWIAGKSVTETADYLISRDTQKYKFNRIEDKNELLVLYHTDVQSQFQILDMLECYLMKPLTFRTQKLWYFSSTAMNHLIIQYFSFDYEVLLRFLVGQGRKLSSKTRKKLFNVALLTGVPLKSCNRQFDNLKTIYNLLTEEISNNHNVGKTTWNRILLDRFGLPEELIDIYIHITYLIYHDFDLSKKRLQFLSWQDLNSITRILINTWHCTTISSEQIGLGGATLIELNRELQLSFEKISIAFNSKPAFQNITKIWRLLVKEFHKKLNNNINNFGDEFDRRLERLEGKNYRFTKALLKLLNKVLSINSNKEYRDFFNELITKVCDLLVDRDLNFTKESASEFLSTYYSRLGDVLSDYYYDNTHNTTTTSTTMNNALKHNNKTSGSGSVVVDDRSVSMDSNVKIQHGWTVFINAVSSCCFILFDGVARSGLSTFSNHRIMERINTTISTTVYTPRSNKKINGGDLNLFNSNTTTNNNNNNNNNNVMGPTSLTSAQPVGSKSTRV